jgi:hypothetical protein
VDEEVVPVKRWLRLGLRSNRKKCEHIQLLIVKLLRRSEWRLPEIQKSQPIDEPPLRSVYEELRDEIEEWSRPLEEEKNRPMIWGLEL